MLDHDAHMAFYPMSPDSRQPSNIAVQNSTDQAIVRSIQPAHGLVNKVSPMIAWEVDMPFIANISEALHRLGRLNSIISLPYIYIYI